MKLLKRTKLGVRGKKKMGAVLKDFKKGTLKSSSGQKVTDRKMALAIGISESMRKK